MDFLSDVIGEARSLSLTKESHLFNRFIVWNVFGTWIVHSRQWVLVGLINILEFFAAKRLAKAVPSRTAGMKLHSKSQERGRKLFCCSGWPDVINSMTVSDLLEAYPLLSSLLYLRKRVKWFHYLRVLGLIFVLDMLSQSEPSCFFITYDTPIVLITFKVKEGEGEKKKSLKISRV